MLSAPAWLAAFGVFTAWVLVLRRPQWADAVQARSGWLYTLLANKYYFDWFNEHVLARLSRGENPLAVTIR